MLASHISEGLKIEKKANDHSSGIMRKINKKKLQKIPVILALLFPCFPHHVPTYQMVLLSLCHPARRDFIH
jgi:hypothetical protein